MNFCNEFFSEIIEDILDTFEETHFCKDLFDDALEEYLDFELVYFCF